MSKKTKLVAAIVIAAASFAVYSAKEQLQQPTSNPPQTTQKQTQVVPPQQDLAQLNYEGTQTIEINQNNPTFSKEELSIENGPWERYSDLDHLNRATDAEALLNKKLMPTEKRGEISSVTDWTKCQLEKFDYRNAPIEQPGNAAFRDGYQILFRKKQQELYPLFRHSRFSR